MRKPVIQTTINGFINEELVIRMSNCSDKHLNVETNLCRQLDWLLRVRVRHRVSALLQRSHERPVEPSSIHFTAMSPR